MPFQRAIVFPLLVPLPLPSAEPRRPYFTYGLMGLLALGFVARLVAPAATAALALSFDDRWHSYFTYAFVARPSIGGGVLLLINLYVLWVIGPPLEARLGPERIGILFLLASLAGAILWHRFNSGVELLEGASTGIAGMIGAMIVLFPAQTFECLFVLLILVIPVMMRRYRVLTVYLLVLFVALHYCLSGLTQNLWAGLGAPPAGLASLIGGCACGALLAGALLVWNRMQDASLPFELPQSEVHAPSRDLDIIMRAAAVARKSTPVAKAATPDEIRREARMLGPTPRDRERFNTLVRGAIAAAPGGTTAIEISRALLDCAEISLAREALEAIIARPKADPALPEVALELARQLATARTEFLRARQLIQSFLEARPNSPHADEARALLATLPESDPEPATDIFAGLDAPTEMFPIPESPVATLSDPFAAPLFVAPQSGLPATSSAEAEKKSTSRATPPPRVPGQRALFEDAPDSFPDPLNERLDQFASLIGSPDDSEAQLPPAVYPPRPGSAGAPLQTSSIYAALSPEDSNAAISFGSDDSSVGLAVESKLQPENQNLLGMQPVMGHAVEIDLGSLSEGPGLPPRDPSFISLQAPRAATKTDQESEPEGVPISLNAAAVSSPPPSSLGTLQQQAAAVRPSSRAPAAGEVARESAAVAHLLCPNIKWPAGDAGLFSVLLADPVHAEGARMEECVGRALGLASSSAQALRECHGVIAVGKSYSDAEALAGELAGCGESSIVAAQVDDFDFGPPREATLLDAHGREAQWTLPEGERRLPWSHAICVSAARIGNAEADNGALIDLLFLSPAMHIRIRDGRFRYPTRLEAESQELRLLRLAQALRHRCRHALFAGSFDLWLTSGLPLPLDQYASEQEWQRAVMWQFLSTFAPSRKFAPMKHL